MIYSNILIAVNIVSINLSPLTGLGLLMICLVIGMAYFVDSGGKESKQDKILKNNPHGDIKNWVLLLYFRLHYLVPA